jgi:hypothetical protein
MKGKAIVTGLCGFFFLVPTAFADPLVASTEKAYRLLQTISSQLKEAQESLGPHSPAVATAALATAEEQVQVAVAHCCRALHAAHLQAAKTALTQRDQQAALQHLLKADETLERCADLSPGMAPQKEQETPAFKSALAQK